MTRAAVRTWTERPDDGRIAAVFSQPWYLKRLTESLNRSLCSLIPDVASDSDSVIIRATLENHTSSRPSPPHWVRIFLDTAPGPVDLDLELAGARALARLIMGLLPDARMDGDLPSRLEEGALLGAMEPILRGLSADLPELSLLEPLTVEGIGTETLLPETGDRLVLRGAIRAGGVTVGFRLAFPAALPPALEPHLDPLILEISGRTLNDAARANPDQRVRSILELGWMNMNCGELASLRAGDALVLPISRSHSGGLIWPRPIRLRPWDPNHHWPVIIGRLHINQGDFAVERTSQSPPGDESMAMEAPEGDPVPEVVTQAGPPGESAKAVHAEMDDVCVRLGDLAEPGPGEWLSLSGDRRSIVRLSIGNRVAGAGELIELETAPAIRLIEVA